MTIEEVREMASPATERSGSGGDAVLAAFLDLTVPEGYRAELIEGEIVVPRRPTETMRTSSAASSAR